MYRDKNIIVIGMARSGVAIAKLLHRLGAHVIVNDRKPREECPEAAELEELGIAVICGGHPEDLIHDQVDLLVKNPGIPYHIKPIEDAIALGISVVTEVEIAGAISQAPIIGITGSNGKTTTTTLVGEILKEDEQNVVVAGNIGQAVADVVADLTADQWLVTELSSFQLKGTETFRPQIGALLNIYPAHLDYHQTIADYRESKLKLFANQTAEDIAILNADHEVCVEIGPQISSRIYWFSRQKEVPQGVFVHEGWIIFRNDGVDKKIAPIACIALQGDCNLENALAAVLIALQAGCKTESIIRVLKRFTGVEHRLEFVKEINGVKYINDSKATNAQAARTGLTSFDARIVWIAGGLDRGVTFDELIPVVHSRVRAVIAYGEAKKRFSFCAKQAEVEVITEVKDVVEAVQKAYEIAHHGEIVLLSPACASWDMYQTFEERGSIFKQAVHTLE
ncbi:UDP-N-acetylmuramoyl-L-alanine--D-glutamate ligase [Hazenella sp. IB182357]|uniref:UDP-N-acetylmuramoylalanine--D-glutamate ligase n=1 Tax=Polycladospora coralii TaxID=2771432 RepID=A0A926N5W5_9BACL|nr:UDP-N-acetylmuramoyl-L-alanine--D-glutamate ligase [Polycladospora coralii]MBD1371321.1 UDP-N-acetylmuramoyl-L-alanine--D-glutamate ligase [Polycladospora coralii]